MYMHSFCVYFFLIVRVKHVVGQIKKINKNREIVSLINYLGNYIPCHLIIVDVFLLDDLMAYIVLFVILVNCRCDNDNNFWIQFSQTQGGIDKPVV